MKNNMKTVKMTMKTDIINRIVDDIDEYIRICYQDIKDGHGLSDLKHFVFNGIETDDYEPNKYVYESLGITLPTDKREYYNLMVEIIRYYQSNDEFADLIIDFKNLFQNSEQVTHLYGLMMFEEYKDEAFQQYLKTSTKPDNIKMVAHYLGVLG